MGLCIGTFITALVLFPRLFPGCFGEETTQGSSEETTASPLELQQGAPEEISTAIVEERFPWCITSETLGEYKPDLPDGQTLLGGAIGPKSKLTSFNPEHYRSNCPQCPFGKIVDKVGYNRIVTNLSPESQYSIYKFLRQWIHIHVQLNTKVFGLVVQANVLPYNLPWGVFDLEFGCKDCNDQKDGSISVNLKDAISDDKKALELGGLAAAIPCRRRTYLHVRHPYVYAFATTKADKKASGFHMNYNYMDITCRLMINRHRLSKLFANAWLLMGKTSVIEHGFVDSFDGMPYPYHSDFHATFSCHNTTTGVNGVFDFRNAGSGELGDIFMREDYYKCIQATPAEFHSNFRDNAHFISNKVCKQPPRTQCNYDDKNNQAPNNTNPAVGETEICVTCNADDNQFTREAFKRLIRRSYKAKRVHGVSMIIGTVAIGVVSIHISRYLKETGGGCLLVGWWLWAHIGLAHVGKGAVYVGLALGMCLPPRENSAEPFDIDTKRIQLVFLHKVFGSLAVILLHVDCVTGPIRPAAPTFRLVMILVHVVIGYLVVIFGCIATVVSTACFDVIIYTVLIMFLSLPFWIGAMVIQVLVDNSSRMRVLKPPRKYFPVIEAVLVPRPQPCLVPRLVILGVLIFFTFLCILLMSVKGSYKGFVLSDPCNNCIWKYDEAIIVEVGEKKSATEPMHSNFSCTLRDGIWDSVLSRPRFSW